MRSRPEAILERKALRLASREVPDVTIHRNEVGHGHPRAVGQLLEQALKAHRAKERRKWLFHSEALEIVESILMRNRITWGLGIGSPDLVIVRGGIELKVPGESLRPSQIECREAWLRAGLAYEVATTPEEVVAAVRRIGGSGG